jgi:hypothetical protein
MFISVICNMELTELNLKVISKHGAPPPPEKDMSILPSYPTLTSLSRDLPEKLIVAQMVKNSPFSFRIRRFTAVFTTIRHWFLS